jgi:hypothetical protein
MIAGTRDWGGNANRQDASNELEGLPAALLGADWRDVGMQVERTRSREVERIAGTRFRGPALLGAGEKARRALSGSWLGT